MVCNYPISIFDHYYNDPDAIREYALSLEYTKAPGFFPGYRTECLSTISKEFWELSYQKFLPDNINPDEYVIRSQLQKIYRFSNDPEDPVNSGSVSYTHRRAHETRHELVCRLLLEKKKNIESRK